MLCADHGIFGVPLQTLLEYDQKKYSAPVIKVPVFVQQVNKFFSV